MAGRIVPEDIDEIRARADIIEVVSGHMQLKKAGRDFKGLCCFHQEKTPSFTVNPEKQLFYCHGCGAGGDVFGFLQQVEGLTFGETAERLAGRYGLTLRFDRSGVPGGTKSPLLAANEAAAKYFSELLMKAPEAEGARRYLKARGFTPEDALSWRLGFSPPGSDVLFRHLLAQKFTAKQIVDAGLAILKESGEHFDRFRSRVMFPVSDLSRQVVGFGARAMGAEQPKYLNSPETAIYRKARILYGLDHSKGEMVKSGTSVVTEGYTDVISLHRIGIHSAVATCGTALGEEHFSLIKRFCDRVVLAFDSDAAGATASERGFGIHARVGLEVLVAPIPAGKDPADVALTEGAEAFGLILEQAIPLVQFVLEREISRHPLDTAEGKARALKDAVVILRSVPSRVARSEYAFWVARRIGVAPEQVQLEIAESGESSAGPATAQAARRPGHIKVEREALAILIGSPSRLAAATEVLNEDHFTQPEHRVLYTILVDVFRRPQGGSVMDRLPDDGTRRLAAELALSPKVTQDPEEVFLRLEEFRLVRQMDEMRATLDRLDSESDAEQYDALFKELMKLDAERRRFDAR